MADWAFEAAIVTRVAAQQKTAPRRETIFELTSDYGYAAFAVPESHLADGFEQQIRGLIYQAIQRMSVREVGDPEIDYIAGALDGTLERFDRR